MPVRTILFDANPIATPKPSGVGYYTYGLISALADAAGDQFRLVGHYYSQGHTDEYLPKGPNISYRPSRLWPPKVVNQLRRQGIDIPIEILARTKADFILYPAFFGPPSLFHTPTTSVIHDVTYLDHPQMVAKRNQQDLARFVPKMLARSAFTITISEFSKQKLLKTYPNVVRDTLVTSVPVTDIQVPPKPQRLIRNLGITKQYILVVGNLEPRKNLGRLAKAYAALSQNLQDHYSLVLAGNEGWNNQADMDTIHRLQKQGHDIVLTGYVDNDTRGALYDQATIMCNASIYEGFGMPVLEAMHCRIPCVISDIPVFHEVAGNAAVYFDPLSHKSVAAALTRLLTNKTLQNKLVKQGYKQATHYSWEAVASQVLNKILAAI